MNDNMFCLCRKNILKDPDLSITNKAVYAVLCSFTTTKDRSMALTVGEIAKAANCSENTIRASLKKLIAKGLIHREERFYIGQQISCLYTLLDMPESRCSDE